jgi:hypothetical protein
LRMQTRADLLPLIKKYGQNLPASASRKLTC